MRKIPSIIHNAIQHSYTISKQNSKYSLIWLHGLGDSCQGFKSFFAHSLSPLHSGARIKLISSPLRKVTINNYELMPSWYDIRSMERFTKPENQVFDLEQMAHSVQILKEHYQSQVKFWKTEQQNQIDPIHRVFVGGFSQGGVIALQFGLRNKVIPAGVITLSSYLLKNNPLDNIGKIPILSMHGEEDPIINMKQALESYGRLNQYPSMLDIKTYPKLEHSVCLEQLSEMSIWLKQANQRLSALYKDISESRLLKEGSNDS